MSMLIGKDKGFMCPYNLYEKRMTWQELSTGSGNMVGNKQRAADTKDEQEIFHGLQKVSHDVCHVITSFRCCIRQNLEFLVQCLDSAFG